MHKFKPGDAVVLPHTDWSPIPACRVVSVNHGRRVTLRTFGCPQRIITVPASQVRPYPA